MSGIVGIWNLDERPVEKAVLTRMSATLAHRGPDGEGMWIQGSAGLACQLLRVTPEAATETQPLVNTSGAVLVFDGRLDNREELLASLKASSGIPSDSPDPALILSAYESFGERFPEQLNGDFALGLFDSGRQQLLLARDAIGIRPLYYTRVRNTFLFASEIKALLAHPQVSSRPNDGVLAGLLARVTAPDNQGLTFFEGVYSLPPAHMAILTPVGFVTRRYWDFDPTRRTRLRTFQEYAEAFRHHFEQAVRRRLRSAYPVAVSVSGGLDSSAIFCLAETLRRRVPDRYPSLLGISYTSTDGSPSDENAFVMEIERAYGVAIERVPMSMGFLSGSRETVRYVEVPFLDEQGNNTQTFLKTTRSLGARVLLTGHWGDQMLFDQAYLVDLFRHLAWGEISTHLKEFGRWYTEEGPNVSSYFKRCFLLDLIKYHVPDLLIPLLRRVRSMTVRDIPDRLWYTERFRSRIRRCASKQTLVRGPFATAHARSLYQEARSRYHVLCMEWNNKVGSMHGLEMAFPFLDRDLLSFLAGIPGQMQTWKGVPKALLRETMRGVLPGVIVQRAWKGDFTHVVNEAMEQEYPQLVHCLEEGMMAVRMGYVREEMIRGELSRLKSRIRGPDCGVTWSLSDLLGIELWLRVFFGDKATRTGAML